MANTNAIHDDNQSNGILGVSSADGVSTLPVRVDPVTGRVLMDITQISSTSVPTLGTTIPRDSNQVPVGRGVTDDTNLTPTPLLISSSNGFLLIDVNVE